MNNIASCETLVFTARIYFAKGVETMQYVLLGFGVTLTVLLVADEISNSKERT